MALSSDRARRRPVILWSTPRSASTAFEKAVMQHPRVEAVHEPFTDCYYFGPNRRNTRYGDCPERARLDRRAVCAEIGRPRKGRVCFIKELAFQALPYVTDSFLGQARHLFLLNEPDAVYASLVRLKADFTEEEFGFTTLFALYQRVRRLTGANSLLFTSRSFRNDPEAALRRVCAAAGLSFTAAMLRWTPGPIRPWKPHEAGSQARYHRTTERSAGIIPYREPDTLVIADPAKRSVVATARCIFATLARIPDGR